MLVATELQAMAEGIRFRNWSFEVVDYMPGADAKSPEPLLHLWFFDQDNRTESARPLKLAQFRKIEPEHRVGDETFLKFVLGTIREHVIHLMQEDFYFNDERVFDPHVIGREAGI